MLSLVIAILIVGYCWTIGVLDIIMYYSNLGYVTVLNKVMNA